MSQIYDASGAAIPVTLVSAPGNIVTAIKTKGNDGYEAVQVGEGSRNPRKINKAQKGVFKDMGNFAALCEFPADVSTAKVGDKVELSQFKAGDMVMVSAISKGKGFQGVVKRHGFHGGPRSHGQKHSEREPGSIGGGLRNRVPVGMRMAGRMGSDRVTVKNLKIAHIDPEENILYISGAVPGKRGTMVEVVGQ